MGKLGKKARKFARKNLQSVLKKKRKLKSLFKKRASKRDERDGAENEEQEKIELPSGRIPGGEDEHTSLDAIFSEDDNDVVEDESESDGYLSEGLGCEHLTENENESMPEDADVSDGSTLAVQNSEIHLELATKRKKLNNLKDKDPKFAKFLESYNKGLAKFRSKDMSDEDETSNDGMLSENEDVYKGKKLTSSAVNSLCQLVAKQHDLSSLIILLNRYRAACHYGVELSSGSDIDSCSGIQEGKNFCTILMFMLHEADGIFRGMLGISRSNCRKEAILELKKGSKWETLKPLIKSYLRGALFLLNQVTDSEILAFALIRLKPSIVFFAAFPSLLQRLIKIAVHMWATGTGALSLHSSLVLQDIASVFGPDCLETCLIKMYKAFVCDCKFLDPALFEHRQFLMNSFIKLCSQDVHKSSGKAMVSIQHLAKIMSLGLRTKKTESLKRICSWQYIKCIDLWVTFIAVNIQDYDLQPLLFMMIQIINGMALLFPGSRYLPLRLKCIQWLNHLSSSSGIFIPVASFALDVLEYSIGKEGGKPANVFNISSNLKLPKNWLKSRNFQQECVFSAIELLAVHFSQWSYHVSFPELATIPLIRLRNFHETTTIESFRRVVKRFIDQVEQNIEFVQKRRDEVAYSPKDQQAADSFLQLEKCSGNAPFTQYYKSLVEKADSRNLVRNEKISSLKKKSKGQKRQPPNNIADIGVNGVNGDVDSDERKANLSIDDGCEGNKAKKMKT